MTKFRKNINKKQGFSLVEVLLAGAVLALLVTSFAGVYIYGRESVMLSGNRNRAVALAEEGLEITRNIRDNSFSDLIPGEHGTTNNNNQWGFSGNSDSIDIYNRKISIEEIDPNIKQIISTVTWRQNSQRMGEVALFSYLTNWRETVAESSCEAFAISEGYLSGICRQNSAKCLDNNEEHLEAGDSYCDSPPNDTCCVEGNGSGGGGISTCEEFVISEGYSSGICRKNFNSCNKNGETYFAGGDVYCSPPNKACCGN